MKGPRHFLRDFTATAVREHLRSEIEATDASPKLTRNEIELVRFICEGSFDWATYLSERSAGVEQDSTVGLMSGRGQSKGASEWT
jgi:hypothetical protein